MLLKRIIKNPLRGQSCETWDLGVKWAGWNIGANKPEDFGSYYAWGETEEKSVYEYKTYSYWQDLDESGDYILPDCKEEIV